MDGSKVVLALIGNKWLSVQDEHGRRRLDSTDDWVRHEVALALEVENRLIPVLVDGAPPVAPEAIDNPPRSPRCLLSRRWSSGERIGRATSRAS